MTKSVSLIEIAKVFSKLGIFGFGGPAAHIAMMRKEVVEDRDWLSPTEFMDLLGATQLIPGPNSTELGIHIGHRMGGWKGLVVAGLCFILPAFLSVLMLAVLYMKLGSLPRFEPVLMAIRPVIVAIVFDALLKFRTSAVPERKTMIIAVVGLILSFLGLNEVYLVLGLGFLYALFFQRSFKSFFVLPLFGSTAVSGATTSSIFLFFLKIGSVLFGSGYVLLAFLQGELVDQQHWLTQKQLLDAVTVGQVTPGPVFTTATFIGYVIGGYSGAVAATVGIFLPSFFFVAMTAPFIHRLRESTFFSKFLDAVNAASFAILLKVTFELGQNSLFDFPTIIIGFSAFIVILKFKKINSAWLILSAGILGFFLFR